MDQNPSRIAVIYYSGTGNTYALAEAFAEGARIEGAEVRLRQAAELAPPEVIAEHARWRDHRERTAHIPVASHADLEWATGYAFGSPTRFGNISSQLKQFIDTTTPLWESGALANKPVTAFTSTDSVHGGQEATLLALYNTIYHWGGVVLPTGYASEVVVNGSHGNPYGVGHSEALTGGAPPPATLEAARAQGRRLAALAGVLAEASLAAAGIS